MSLYAPNKFGYVQQAEAYFLGLSTVGVVLSSRDTELLRSWRARGVSLDTICSGIRHAFQVFDDPPRSIYQCRHHIEYEIRARSAVRQYNTRSPDTHLPKPETTPPTRTLHDPTNHQARRDRRARLLGIIPPSTPARTSPPPKPDKKLDSWQRSMDHLIELGSKTTSKVLKHFYRQAYRDMLDLRLEALREPDRAHLEHALPMAICAIEATMFLQIYNSLHDDQKEAVDNCLTEPMIQSLRYMADDAKTQQLHVWRRKIMSEMFGIEPFYIP